MRPRCRWRIGVKQGVELQPYRLLVSLVENRRINGKVRQEHIADLGAIDGCLLPGFYAAVDPAVVEAILSDHWQRTSIYARADFWRGVHQVLSRLANRIGLDAGKIIEAIAARIPILTVEETEAMARWPDDDLIKKWQFNAEFFVRIATREEDQLKYFEEKIKQARNNVALLQPAIAAAKQGGEETQQAIQRGHRETVEHLNDECHEMSMELGKLLARRMRNW